MRNCFVIALSLPALMACMPAFGADPVLAPQQVALVQETCDKVMGLKEGGEYRSLCQDSLSKSLARKLAAENRHGDTTPAAARVCTMPRLRPACLTGPTGPLLLPRSRYRSLMT